MINSIGCVGGAEEYDEAVGVIDPDDLVDEAPGLVPGDCEHVADFLGIEVVNSVDHQGEVCQLG